LERPSLERTGRGAVESRVPHGATEFTPWSVGAGSQHRRVSPRGALRHRETSPPLPAMRPPRESHFEAEVATIHAHTAAQSVGPSRASPRRVPDDLERGEVTHTGNDVKGTVWDEATVHSKAGSWRRQESTVPFCRRPTDPRAPHDGGPSSPQKPIGGLRRLRPAADGWRTSHLCPISVVGPSWQHRIRFLDQCLDLLQSPGELANEASRRPRDGMSFGLYTGFFGQITHGPTRQVRSMVALLRWGFRARHNDIILAPPQMSLVARGAVARLPRPAAVSQHFPRGLRQSC
jgi:hypothetical protein